MRGFQSGRAATNSPGVVAGYTRNAGAYARSIPIRSTEKKYFDTSLADTSDHSAGIVLPSLCLLPQGTTDQKRIGNKVTIRNINLHLSGSLDDQGTGVFSDGCYRVIVFIDKQCNGAAAAVTDILNTANISSFRNMDQVDRFTILKDKMYVLPCRSTNVLHTISPLIRVNWSKKCNIPVHFSSTTGAITEIRSNNIGILFISNTVNENTGGIARIKFTDD